MLLTGPVVRAAQRDGLFTEVNAIPFANHRSTVNAELLQKANQLYLVQMDPESDNDLAALAGEVAGWKLARTRHAGRHGRLRPSPRCKRVGSGSSNLARGGHQNKDFKSAPVRGGQPPQSRRSGLVGPKPEFLHPGHRNN